MAFQQAMSGAISWSEARSLTARPPATPARARTRAKAPLSQYLLADALGLSAVHVNRVLRTLREQGLVTFLKGRVTFDDFDGLVDLAGFDASYLDQNGPLLR